MPLDIHPERSLPQQMPPQRMIVLPWSLLALALGLMTGGAFYASRVDGAEVFRAPDQNGRPMALKLLDEPCKDEVVKWLPIRVRPEFHAGMKAAILHWEGRDWKACWIDVDGDIYSIDEEGVFLNGGGGTPRRLFRDDSI